jgi:carboxyl-terminal processing protease
MGVTVAMKGNISDGRMCVARIALVALALNLISATGCDDADVTSDREQAFTQVWGTINSSFYDETFGGHNWQALGDEYRDKALLAPTEKEFYITLNTMLFRLEVSHIGVIPNDHPEWIGAPASFADGEVGLNLRIVDNRLVIIRRKAILDDLALDLQPGTVITSLNGLTLDDFMTEVTTPPVPAIRPQLLATERAERELFRDAGKTVEIAYLDRSGAEQKTNLTAFAREGAVELIEGIPPVYLDFEKRVIDEQFGYIRFSSFHGDLTERIIAAIDEYHDMAGLIIDLRGNVGGDFQVRRAIAEHLIRESVRVWQYVGRRGPDDINLDPSPKPYEGKVVFIVDEMSASSAEELSGAMQALGRAKVIGNRTAGMVLVADVLPLDIGASLIYPVAETRFVNGYAPEGKGIIPDVSVPYEITTLRAGRDAQLVAAIRMLQE